LVDADRQWFKSRQGLDATETPRNISFCGHAILDDKIMIVNDASEDQRFCDNPLVCNDPNIRFYAGYPLSAPDGSRVGTLCVIDRVPREITDEQAQLLRELGRMVEEELMEADVATSDPITSLSNRNGFLMIAEHLLSMCVRTEQPVTMLLVHFQNLQDIDNDFGRAAGDAASVEFAHQLASTFRNSDIVARIASDFYCVLLAGTDLENVDPVRQRFNEEIGAHNRDSDSRHEFSIDIDAIAFKPDRHGDAGGLLKDAERRIYDPQVTAA
jgi:diguanylate cyclase (GGDEF)-like protein